MSEWKKGILVVSFGTSYEETRRKTLDRIEQDVQARYPDRPVCRAFTSGKIREKLRTRDGIEIPDVTGAMEKMAEDGINEVYIQPTFVIRGHEYDQMISEARSCRPLFARVFAGSPLLSLREDRTRVIQILAQELQLKKEQAYVLMGHSSDHPSNSVYASLDRELKTLGYPNIFLGTVEATPTFGTVMRKVKKLHPEQVVLAPFMMVAGNHALNDLAGEQEDSWKSRFEQEGFSVSCSMRGLGEYEEIRALLIEHLEEAAEL